jgi:hypothetical protein
MGKLDDGALCPCCGQYAKRYRRKLSALMARWLIALVRLSPKGEWVHAHDVFTALGKRGSNASDYCYLERWGMIEPAPPDAVPVRPELKPGRSGHWRPTAVGRNFVAGALQVSSVVVMYGSRLEGFEGSLVTIQQALAKKFVYEELMRGNYAPRP